MSTYLNDRGFAPMKAKASGRGLASADGRFEGAMRVLYATHDLSGEEAVFIVVKVWLDNVCNHKVIDVRDGVTMAEGRGTPKESESWEMAKAQLAARGYTVG